ncbi:MAG: MFS transporter, partial [SAR202 cluster bacterium]|nr:MFS transporter [SAR202 cluster bacterium]MQG51929.1 MFS transporter [SAR202 cluster bacterium]
MRLPRLQTLDSWRQYPNYRYLWTGNLFSNGAQWLQLFTAGWLVWELSKDTGTTGLFVASLGAINLLPSILIGPIGGVLGDRFNRKYLIMILQSFMACVAILFALLNTTDLVEVWHVYAYVIVSGCCLCICQPMRNALVANTVPREMIGNAMAVNVFTITGTRMIGPFFGGILIANLGFQWNFGIEACLYLGTVIALIRLKLPYREASKSSNQIGVFQSLKEGISYIRKED